MKRILFSLLLLFVIISCNKWKGDQQRTLTYYTEDYKEKEMEILDVSSSEIDALWVEFSNKNEQKEYTNYVLIVKSNGTFTKEIGTCQIEWDNQITFTPENGDSYIGKWIYEKEKYTITYNLEDREETLTFIYKETKGYKKGK